MSNIQKSISNNNKRIILVLLFSFLFVTFTAPKIFLSSTPKINPQFISMLINLPKNITLLPKTLSTIVRNPGSSQTASINLKQLDQISLHQVTKGVFAGESGKVEYYKVSLGQVDWDQITLHTKSGATIVLRYPKNQPPAQEMLKIIQSQ